MNGVLYVSIVALVMGVALWLERRGHASSGPDGEKPSRGRQGDRPTEAPVVSGGTHLDPAKLKPTAEPARAECRPTHTAGPGAQAGAIPGCKSLPGPLSLSRPEQAPACDRALDLLSDSNNHVASSTRRGVDWPTAGAGAPVVFYWWRSPERAKKLMAVGWTLVWIDPRYGDFLVRKEQRGW